MFQRILVALDYADRSREALDQAIQLAKLTSAEIMLLHGLSTLDDDAPPHSYPFTEIGYVDAAVYAELMQRYAQQWQQYEQKHAQRLRSFAREAEIAGVHVNWTQCYGDVGREICRVAAEWPADLIVMGRRGRTGLKEALLGSVSNYVLHYAPCTVLIVQGNVHPSSELAEQREGVAI